MYIATPVIIKNIFQLRDVNSTHRASAINEPQFTTNPPQLHHKNTTQKTRISQNTPQKRLQKTQKSPGNRRGFFF
jgi:hypothetical protein